MRDLFTAVALMFVIEGILYSLFPEGMKRMVAKIMALPASALRLTGLAVAVIGVAAVWLIRG